MKKIILTLSLAALVTGAVSTNAYAADFTQLKNGQSVIVKRINSDCINNIDDLFNGPIDTTTIVNDSNKTTVDKTTANETTNDKTTSNEASVDKTTTNDTNKATNQSYAEKIVELVNKERAKAGLSAVKIDTKLATAATKRAHEIETSFAHTRPNGSNFNTVINENGVNYRGAGENIAYGQKTPEEVMNGWMNSEGHRANILNASFTTIGVGYYQNAAGVNHWVQLFTY
jgi:uncharacterized protein YkwD